MKLIWIVAPLVLAWNLCFYGAIAWGVVSLATSGVKAVSKSCGTTYTIDKIVAGNLFCPTVEK